MAIRKKAYKKYIVGGDYRGPYGYEDASLIDPRNDPKNNAIGQSATGVVSSLPGGQYWGALSTLGTGVSKQIRGSGTDAQSNTAANFVNPWNQFEDNKSTGDWARSFLDPAGSVIMKGQRQKDAQLAYNKRVGMAKQKATFLNSSPTVAGFDATGSNQNTLYAKYGGGINKLAIGGDLENISEDNQEVQGRSHEEGGVKFPKQGVELEGGETVNDGDFVFSKELGFADIHKPIARAIGKIEKKPDTMIKKTSLARLKAREEELKQQQETLKQELGIGENLTSYLNGGDISRFNNMGNTFSPADGYTPNYGLEPITASQQNPEAFQLGVRSKRGYHLNMANGGGIPNSAMERGIPNPNFHFYQTYDDGGPLSFFTNRHPGLGGTVLDAAGNSLSNLAKNAGESWNRLVQASEKKQGNTFVRGQFRRR